MIYHGDHIRCRMQVHGNPNFIVKVPNAAGVVHLAAGATTPVGWGAEDCRALDG
jgi:putative spermidine/putrescine transport system ATP-binding protein